MELNVVKNEGNTNAWKIFVANWSIFQQRNPQLFHSDLNSLVGTAMALVPSWLTFGGWPTVLHLPIEEATFTSATSAAPALPRRSDFKVQGAFLVKDGCWRWLEWGGCVQWIAVSRSAAWDIMRLDVFSLVQAWTFHQVAFIPRLSAREASKIATGQCHQMPSHQM